MVAKGKPGSVRQKNPGWLQRLVKRYHNNEVLAIGWPSGPATSIRDPDGVPVVLKAAVNNFGSASRGIPARPFMSRGLTNAQEATKPIRELLVPKINQGKITPAQILEHCGPFAVAAVQETIQDGPWVPNAPYTVEQKGSDTPLIDKGLMKQSVTYVVRDK